MVLSGGVSRLAVMQQSIDELRAHLESLITEEMHLIGLEVQDSLSGQDLRRLGEIRFTLDQFEKVLKRRAH